MIPFGKRAKKLPTVQRPNDSSVPLGMVCYSFASLYELEVRNTLRKELG